MSDSKDNLTVEGYVDAEKVVGILRAEIKKKDSSLQMALTVTKYIGAAAAGAAIQFALTHQW